MGGNRRILRQCDVDNLRSVTISDEDELMTQACAICLDDFNLSESVKALPCGHYFHEQCASEWLTRWKNTCPLCKAAVEPEFTATQEELSINLYSSRSSDRRVPPGINSLEHIPLIELGHSTTPSFNYTNPQP